MLVLLCHSHSEIGITATSAMENCYGSRLIQVKNLLGFNIDEAIGGLFKQSHSRESGDKVKLTKVGAKETEE